MITQPEHSQFSLFIVYRYDSTTGMFTVSPGGDGYYYFFTHLTGSNGEFSIFDIQINGETLCAVIVEQEETSGDVLQASCGAATLATQGRETLYFVQ